MSIVTLLVAIDEYTFGASTMGRLLFIAPITRLIPRDFQTGVIIDAMLELILVESTMVGSATPPEVYASSVLGTAIAIQSGEGVGIAVIPALPLSVPLRVWRSGCYVIGASWGGKQIEKALAQRNLRRVNMWHLIILPLVVDVPSMPLVFFAMYFGAGSINAVIKLIPQVVLDGFDVAAGVLSCMGLTLLIKMMGNKKLMSYLPLGFIAVMYISTDVIGVAVTGLCMVLIAVRNMKFEEGEDFQIQEIKETSLIAKKGLHNVFWRSFIMRSSWSLDKMMTYGFMYSIEKSLREIYPKDDGYSEALHRHTETSDTTPRVSPFVIDLSVAVEQKCAKADNFNKGSIDNLEMRLMGPPFGIDSSLFWSTFRVIAMGIGTVFVQQGNILGALLYFFLYTTIHFLIRYITGNAGYKMGVRFLESSAKDHFIKRMSYRASILRLTVTGVMTGTVVTLKTSLTFQFSGTETILQSIFDQIFPGLLPLGATFLCVQLFNRNVKTTVIILGIFVTYIAECWIGIFQGGWKVTKLVVFDLDGTLSVIHTHAVAIYQETLKELGAGSVAKSVVRSGFGAPFRNDNLFSLGDDSEEVFRRFCRTAERHWAPLMREKAQAYPGVPETFGELKEQGYVLAVCSDAEEEELEGVLSVLPIRGCFDYIQGLTSRQDKVGSLGVLIERADADWCCMAGDRFYDRETAKANETAFIGCRYGYGGAGESGNGDLLAGDDTEIPGLLKRLVFPTPWLKPWQRPWGGHGTGVTGGCGGFRDSINLLKKEKTLFVIG